MTSLPPAPTADDKNRWMHRNWTKPLLRQDLLDMAEAYTHALARIEDLEACVAGWEATGINPEDCTVVETPDWLIRRYEPGSRTIPMGIVLSAEEPTWTLWLESRLAQQYTHHASTTQTHFLVPVPFTSFAEAKECMEELLADRGRIEALMAEQVYLQDRFTKTIAGWKDKQALTDAEMIHVRPEADEPDREVQRLEEGSKITHVRRPGEGLVMADGTVRGPKPTHGCFS